MTRALPLIVSLVVCSLTLSCSGDESPSAPSTQPPVVVPPPIVTPPAALSRIVLEGNVTLTDVGETSQFKAMAEYADGSRADASTQARWFSQNPLVSTVSQLGLLTVVGLGNTLVSATFQGKFASTRVVATPPGTVTVSGQVREPGQGGGVGLRPSGVRVSESRSGRSMTTDDEGYFALGGLTSTRVRFERDDLEPREVDLQVDRFDDVPVQRIVRMAAGETVSPVALAPNDMDYTMGSGEHCFPCRMIRIDVAASGTLHVGLRWTNAAAAMSVWVNGVRYVRSSSTAVAVDADVQVSAGQRVIYVQGTQSGGQIGHLSFTLETAYTP